MIRKCCMAAHLNRWIDFQLLSTLSGEKSRDLKLCRYLREKCDKMESRKFCIFIPFPPLFKKWHDSWYWSTFTLSSLGWPFHPDLGRPLWMAPNGHSLWQNMGELRQYFMLPNLSNRKSISGINHYQNGKKYLRPLSDCQSQSAWRKTLNFRCAGQK